MDHNYARGKLTLLLRDIRNYNAGEFWREMSRIASGATASIHAEGLKAERAALADSNTQLMQQNEAQIKMNAQLMHERDALAAQVEEMTVAIIEANEHEDGSLDQKNAYRSVYMQSAMYPATSLARRDALMKAEALDDFSEKLGGTDQELAEIEASRYRRKAEGGDA